METRRHFFLEFEFASLEVLDKIALVACQDCNLGNRGDWFGCFRGGLHGLHARVYAVRGHFYDVHAWVPSRRLPVETESQVSTILFNMDSAIECFVFMLNALGWAIAPDQFLDVTDGKTLKRIAPRNIVGTQSVLGYSTYFPSLQRHWAAHTELLQMITDQHDVSKHRTAISQGGQHRSDAPAGFYESLGIPDDPSARFLFWPMAEILLMPNPKGPVASRTPTSADQCPMLEQLAEQFCAFMNLSCDKALDDAATI